MVSNRIAGQLDKRLKSLHSLDLAGPPASGWIRAIRDALGITASELAARMQVKQPTATAIEQSEAARTITLGTLDRAAHALGCRVVYALIPEQPLEKTILNRAREVAEKRLRSVSQTMCLENQEVDREFEKQQLDELIAHLVAEPRRLWADKTDK